MASEKPKYYWDACIWIELINNPDGMRSQCCKHVLERAKKNECEIRRKLMETST